MAPVPGGGGFAIDKLDISSRSGANLRNAGTFGTGHKTVIHGLKVPWYAWAAVALAAVVIITKRG